MTREDRDAEIADQRRYLDALHARVMESLGEGEPAVSLLGFSQGVATMGRWLASGAVRPGCVVVWAGRLPAELEPEQLRVLLRDARVVVVVGSSDELAPASEVELEAERLRQAGVAFERLTFDGGHELDTEMLMSIFPTAQPQAGSSLDAPGLP